MRLRRRARVIALAMLCGCWPAPPADEPGDDASTSGPAASLCFDGIRDGDETDIDCGGSVCTGCFGADVCADHGDCASGYCGAGRCAYLRSCYELQQRANGDDGVFWVDFDAEGPEPPVRALCDQSTDGGGWMLGIKVHRAAHDNVTERRDTLRDGFNPNLLLDVTTTLDRGLASHGTVALSNALGPDPRARITLVAGADETQTATWFKRIASARSLSRWFYDDDESSLVCVDLDAGTGCEMGVIAHDSEVTQLRGVHLLAHEYAADASIYLRLSGSGEDPVDGVHTLAGVCSATKDNDDNRWNDSLASEWGNGLLIWIR
jgi:hypothetical protein